MAKLCAVCASLCVFFIVFFIKSTIATNDYDFYNVANLEHSDLLHIYKRDTPIENNQSNSPPTPPPTQIIVTAKNETSNATTDDNDDIVTLEVNKTQVSTTKTKLEKSSKVPILVTTTTFKPPQSVEPTPHKNLLGFNGTGIRKNITSTPILVNHTQLNTLLKSNVSVFNNEEYPEDVRSEQFNKTLTENNITMEKIDSQLYYNSTLKTDPEMGRYYWVDLANRSDAKVNELLSKSHRRAATVQLSFDFPFYGHLIKNVTIATGGFLYTGDYVHSWLAATQYIAPLMANFDTSISNESFIRYVDNGTAFTVEWERVALQDKPNEGEFTFQTTLHKNGDIVFVYQNVPLLIENIEDAHHPVKVGLSDAYIIDRTIFFVRRKSIYEYHRVDFLKEDIKNWTVIYLKALPTCLDAHECHSCVTKKLPTVQCFWCPSTNRCSSGVDRKRQDWLMKNCDKNQLESEQMCQSSGSNEEDQSMEDFSKTSSRIYDSNHFESNNSVKMGVSSIVAILFLISMVAGLGVWVFYAYRNPHTTSGQILIRYRPSQWRWRRGEARYTAATIHM